MKTSLSFLSALLIFCLLGLTACTDDDTAVITLDEETLNYDGPNFTAPFNGAGTTTFAAYFPATEVQSLVGRSLQRIDFWLQTIPEATVVSVYSVSGNDRSPGTLLYSIDLTQRINNTGWYEHVIPAESPIEIPADGLWLAVAATLQDNGTQAIGCDAGDNYSPNGDRLLPPTGGTWTSFNEITGSESINWNIRGVLAAE